MIRVLFVEASTGGVLGGSLTGLYHLIRGMDRTGFASGMVLYEPKGIEDDLARLDVPVFYVTRRRVEKEHALLRYEGYRQAKSWQPVRSALALGRQTLRLAIEEMPTALRLARIIRRFRADVVHLGNGLRANFDGVLACMMTRTPCLVHVKGFEKFTDRERRIAPRVDALVSMTQAVDAHCRRLGVIGRSMYVVYDALDEQGFVPRREPGAVRAELGITNGSPCVGVVGNIQEWKGQAVLVEAMARVVEAVPRARALIIGGVHRAGAQYGDALRARIAELGLGESIAFTGFRRDVPDVMNALDVVAHTSVRAEPFGRVILEAMLLGKPVVATAAGGVPELIADGTTGFLTPPGEPAALAERLIPLLRDADLRSRVGIEARRWARERFNLPRHVAETCAIYEQLTKGH
ncbi:glycosyltransferase [Candidatus Binatia bacterium]|nr:glycosyltransferase [Candidatus Binatia bacterium]